MEWDPVWSEMALTRPRLQKAGTTANEQAVLWGELCLSKTKLPCAVHNRQLMTHVHTQDTKTQAFTLLLGFSPVPIRNLFTSVSVCVTFLSNERRERVPSSLPPLGRTASARVANGRGRNQPAQTQTAGDWLVDRQSPRQGSCVVTLLSGTPESYSLQDERPWALASGTWGATDRRTEKRVALHSLPGSNSALRLRSNRRRRSHNLPVRSRRAG